MRLRPAPALATWFLKLFCSSAEHEALVGDLLEQYQSGRGRFWCWRQVLAIVFLELNRKVRRLSVSTDSLPIRQGLVLIFLVPILSAVLLSDIWVLLLIGILGGIVTGGLLFALRNSGSGPVKSDPAGVSPMTDAPTYHRGISIQHIPVEGAVGLLFVLATGLIFAGGIAAIREILVVTAPLGILALGILVYWHKHHPLKMVALDLHKPRENR